jgi:hypothetical protein
LWVVNYCDNQAVESYDKHNVLSMQLMGGEAQYGTAPKLVEYTVALTQVGDSWLGI